MFKHTYVYAAVAATALVVAGCSSNPDDGIPQDMRDWAATQSQVAQDSARSYQTTTTPRQGVVPAETGNPITIGDNLVTINITSIRTTQSCSTRSGSMYEPDEGQYVVIDYTLDAGDIPPASGIKWTTLDADGYTQNTGPEAPCNGDSPTLNQFGGHEKARGTYYLDAPTDAAQLKAEPRFGWSENSTLPAGWTWQIPR